MGGLTSSIICYTCYTTVHQVSFHATTTNFPLLFVSDGLVMQHARTSSWCVDVGDVTTNAETNPTEVSYYMLPYIPSFNKSAEVTIPVESARNVR